PMLQYLSPAPVVCLLDRHHLLSRSLPRRTTGQLDKDSATIRASSLELAGSYRVVKYESGADDQEPPTGRTVVLRAVVTRLLPHHVNGYVSLTVDRIAGTLRAVHHSTEVSRTEQHPLQIAGTPTR